MLDELRSQISEYPDAHWTIKAISGADLGHMKIIGIDQVGIAVRINDQYVTTFVPWSNVARISMS